MRSLRNTECGSLVASRVLAFVLFVAPSEGSTSPPSAPPLATTKSDTTTGLEAWEVATIASVSSVAFVCCAYATYLHFTITAKSRPASQSKTSELPAPAGRQYGLARDIPALWNSPERRLRNPRPAFPTVEEYGRFVELPFEFGRGTPRFAEWLETNVRMDGEEGRDVSRYTGTESVVQKGKKKARDGARRAIQGARRVRDVVLDESKLDRDSSSDPSESEDSPPKKPDPARATREAAAGSRNDKASKKKKGSQRKGPRK